MKKRTYRTYYGFQLIAPVFPGEMDCVLTNKPVNGYQVKCRAANLTEAREKLNQKWHDICEEAMTKKERP